MWDRLTGSSSSSRRSGRARQQQQQPPPAELPPDLPSAANDDFGAVHIPLGDDDSASLLYPHPPLDRNMYTQSYGGYSLPPDASTYAGMGSSSFHADPTFQPYPQLFQGDSTTAEHSGNYYQPYGAYASYSQPSFEAPFDPHQQTSYFHQGGPSSTTPYAMPPSATEEGYEYGTSATQTTQALDRLNIGGVAASALQRLRTGGGSRPGREVGSSSSISGAHTSRVHRVQWDEEEQAADGDDERGVPQTARFGSGPRGMFEAPPSGREVNRRARQTRKAWLTEKWQQLGLNADTMPAQELAQEVTALKIRYPDRATSIGKNSMQFVEEVRGPATAPPGQVFSLENEEYHYDYTTWINTYAAKASKTKMYYGNSMSAEELKEFMLSTFRSVKPRHHATLADPVLEHEQQVIATKVWIDFMAKQLCLYLTHDGGTVTDQDINAIFEAGRHYRYLSMDQNDSLRYIRKYLAKIARWRPCHVTHLEVLQKQLLHNPRGEGSRN